MKFYLHSVVLGGVMFNVFAISSRVEGDGFLRVITNLQCTFFWRGSKDVGFMF
jgi:hypothetical protein